jgi:hypothetical protein
MSSFLSDFRFSLLCSWFHFLSPFNYLLFSLPLDQSKGLHSHRRDNMRQITGEDPDPEKEDFLKNKKLLSEKCM